MILKHVVLIIKINKFEITLGYGVRHILWVKLPESEYNPVEKNVLKKQHKH